MSVNAKPGAVIFTGDPGRMVRFYEAVTGLTVCWTDAHVTVLGSDGFELVIHALAGEPVAGSLASARRDAYIKPFFIVASLAATREKAAALGGRLEPPEDEWEARGFRASEGVDPDGNVIQFREPASGRR